MANLNQDDFVAAGFERIEEDKVSQNPPKIRWGLRYQNMSPDEKVKYLEKFAHSMNHAAAMLQDERNKLNELLVRKEAQLEAGGRAMSQNNDMIQIQITKHNEDKQAFLTEIARLKARVRELEAQVGD